MLMANYLDLSGCAAGYATIMVANLRCRAEPILDSAIVGTWPLNARIIVWAQKADGWWLVEAEQGGMLGWSFSPAYMQIDN